MTTRERLYEFYIIALVALIGWSVYRYTHMAHDVQPNPACIR